MLRIPPALRRRTDHPLEHRREVGLRTEARKLRGIEQNYVLEGKLVDKEGPAAGLEVKPGEFVWREPGSRHVAWTPEGGLMLAMFQIPNKFYEGDGRVTDVAGQDWETVWGRALKS